jgi:hypothetical protein
MPTQCHRALPAVVAHSSNLFLGIWADLRPLLTLVSGFSLCENSSAAAAGRRYRIGGGYPEPFGFLVAVFEDVEQLCAQCIGLAERFEEVEAGYCRRMVFQTLILQPRWSAASDWRGKCSSAWENVS